MRRSRHSLTLSDIVHMSAGLAALAGATAGLGGCTGPDVAQLYGYQAVVVETGSIDTSGHSSRMSRLEQDAIIGEAIAAHEMRRP